MRENDRNYPSEDDVAPMVAALMVLVTCAICIVIVLFFLRGAIP